MNDRKKAASAAWHILRVIFWVLVLVVAWKLLAFIFDIFLAILFSIPMVAIFVIGTLAVFAIIIKISPKFGSLANRLWHALLFICGTLALLVAFFLLAMLVTPALIFLANIANNVPQDGLLISNMSMAGLVFVLCYLFFSAGAFLLQRSGARHLFSAATNRKLAWVSNSISFQALLNATLRRCTNFAKSILDWYRNAGLSYRLSFWGGVIFLLGLAGTGSYFLPKPDDSPSKMMMGVFFAECLPGNAGHINDNPYSDLKPLEQLTPMERGMLLECAAHKREPYMVRWVLGTKFVPISVDNVDNRTSWPMAKIAGWADSKDAIEAIDLLREREGDIFSATAISEQRLDAAYNAGTVKVARYLDSLWPELVQGERNRMNSIGQNTSKYSHLTLAQYHALHGRFDVAQYFEGKGSKIKPMRHLIFDITKEPQFDDNKLDQFLVSRGDMIDERDAQNRTQLHRAVEKYDGEKLVRHLIDRGADVNAQDIAGDTPLHYMVREGNNLWLLDRANLNLQNFKGRTPLHEALAASAWGKATALLDRGARFDVRDIQGRTPLLDCALQACPLLDRLMAPGAGISAVDADGNSLLHLVAQAKGNKAEMIGKMLAKGAPYNSKNKAGQTPLHLFSKSGDVGLVKLLLAKGCNPNGVDAMGNTPLHFAPTAEMVSSLLHAGANPDLANQRGERPLDGNVARTQMLFHSPSQINSKSETLPHYFRDVRIGEERVELVSPTAGTFMLGGDDSDEARHGAIWFIARTPGLEYRIEQSCQTSVRLEKAGDFLILKPVPDSGWTVLTSSEREGVFLLRGQSTSCALNIPTNTIVKYLMRRGKRVTAKWLGAAKLCNSNDRSACKTWVTPVLRVSVKDGGGWNKVGALSARNPELAAKR